MADLAVMALPINRNVPPQYDALVEQLPAEWKVPYAQLIASAAGLYQNLKDYYNTIQSVCHLEDLVNANNLPDPSTVDSVMDKCKNVAESIRNAVKDFVCSDRSTCEKNFEQIWEAAKNDVLSQLKKEKMEAADNCVKAQAILSAIIIVIEFQAICSVWKDIQNAENIIKTCKERDIPVIQARIEELKRDESELKKLIEEYLKGGNPGLLANLRALSFSLILKINSTRNLINDIKYQINEKVACIGQQRDDQFRRGVTNTAQTIGSIFQYCRLAANMSSPYMWLQAGITTTFGLLTVSNVVTYKMCGKKLAELREVMLLVRTMERFVEDMQDVIRQAEAIYLNNNNR